MSPVHKFIFAAAELSITVALIYVGFRVFSDSKKVSDETSKKQNKLITETQEYSLTQYDGMTIPGAEAINSIKTAITEFEASATVVRSNGDEIKVSTSSEFYLLRDVNSTKFINPLKLFYCTVQRDENEIIEGIILSEVP